MGCYQTRKLNYPEFSDFPESYYTNFPEYIPRRLNVEKISSAGHNTID